MHDWTAVHAALSRGLGQLGALAEVLHGRTEIETAAISDLLDQTREALLSALEIASPRAAELSTDLVTVIVRGRFLVPGKDGQGPQAAGHWALLVDTTSEERAIALVRAHWQREERPVTEIATKSQSFRPEMLIDLGGGQFLR